MVCIDLVVLSGMEYLQTVYESMDDVKTCVPIAPISDDLGPNPNFFPFESRGEESAHNPLAMP